MPRAESSRPPRAKRREVSNTVDSVSRSEAAVGAPEPVPSNNLPLDAVAAIAQEVSAIQQRSTTTNRLHESDIAAIAQRVAEYNRNQETSASLQSNRTEGEVIGAQQSAASNITCTSDNSNVANILDAVFSVSGSSKSSTVSGPSARLASVRLTEDLSPIASQILKASLAPGSRAAYHRPWQLFFSFHGHNYQLPVSLSHLCNFIENLYEKGYSASSISSHVSAIGYVHKLNSFPDPTQTFLIKEMLSGCHKLLPSADTRLPITKEILVKILHALKHTVSVNINRVMLKTIFLLCFNAFLRMGEVVVKTSAGINQVLQCEDVTFYSENNRVTRAQIILNNFKTKRSSAPAVIYLCPVTAFCEYRSIFSHISGPFVQFIGDTLVPYAYVSAQLSAAIQFCGLDATKYKNHSFRIGAATSAASLGFSENEIQSLGRWSSYAVKRYIRIPSFSV